MTKNKEIKRLVFTIKGNVYRSFLDTAGFDNVYTKATLRKMLYEVKFETNRFMRRQFRSIKSA